MAYEDTPGANDGVEVSMGDTVEALREAYDYLEMPIRKYLVVVLFPSVVFFVATVLLVLAVELPLMIALPIPLLGLLGVVTAVIYPKLIIEQERQELDNRLHLLITHMTVLSTTKIDRMEVFRRLGQEDEYRALADEINRVVQLVDTWNQSLDDALRRRAQQVPSKPLADFFDRLAYTMGAGQELSDFLLSEQSVIIQNYVTVYESTLGNLEVMKDLYLSMILSMSFALVFAVVLPVLTGTDPTMTVAAVIVMFVFVQTGFYLAIRSITPYDPVWYLADEIDPRSEPRLRKGVAVGAALSVFLLVVVLADVLGVNPVPLATFLPTPTVPLPIYAVVPITPLLVPGLIIRGMESDIKDRDQGFPSFIRALGAAESAKQSTTSAVLSDLRGKDFGALTEDVNNLFKRLNMRIEPSKAWKYFAADTQSYLIQKFSEMYLVGRQMGGEPKLLGELISANMNEVNQLRERRKQATVTLIGVLYGITAASTFAFFIGIEIVNMISNMTVDLSAGNTAAGQIINTSAYDIPVVEALLVTVILFNALLSSLMIRTVDGGHKMNAYLHFVVLAWIGAVIGVVTRYVVSTLIAV